MTNTSLPLLQMCACQNVYALPRTRRWKQQLNPMNSQFTCYLIWQSRSLVVHCCLSCAHWINTSKLENLGVI